MTRVLMRVFGSLLICAAILSSRAAFAQTSGSIEGVVTDQATKRPLAGVTVTISGAALQGEQTEFTDASGHYIITELPPGEYVVRFYFSNLTVERNNVFLQVDKTLRVNAAMPTQRAKTQTYRIVEKAPTVDVGNTQVQTQVSNELVRNTPIAGVNGRRTFESVMTLAPGAAADPVGVSFNGATGPENSFLIDGMNTTNPAFGLIGTQLTLEFIGETEIVTGGYNAEYGRATGGVVNAITKSGSNQFHGDAWFYYTPFQLRPNAVARLGEAIASTNRLNRAMDFGVDIGGPIVKDRIWFYGGFAPTLSVQTTERELRNRVADNAPTMANGGPYLGDKDMNAKCPSWIGSGLCAGSGYLTRSIPGSLHAYDTNTNLYNWIAKFNFQLNPNNSLVLQYIGSPVTTDGRGNLATGQPLSINGLPSTFLESTTSQVHDVLAHFVSKLADRKLQIDALAGYHFESKDETPNSNAPLVQEQRTAPLSRYEDVPNGGCDVRTLANGQTFNPCPVINFNSGGYGQYRRTQDQRISAQLGATYFLRLAGTHALKIGGDFEDNIYRDFRAYTGGERLQIRADGTVRRRTYGIAGPTPSSDPVQLPSFDATTNTFNESLYLRDSYNVGFFPGLTINVGARFEFEQVRDIHGVDQIDIWDNIAPRVGLIYDWTRKGRSKLFASYGRFYESIPLDINDRQFSGEGLLETNVIPNTPGYCMTNSKGGIIPSTCQFSPTRKDLNGGSFGAVQPNLKGQYSNEVVVGAQYDIGFDTVVGAQYIHRDLGRIIEDASPDGGNTYIIANPGEPTDSGVVKDLQKKIASATDMKQKIALQQQLSLYQGIASFEKPRREYNALVLTANKRLSHNFILLASYTYSRTEGNYPGLFQASNGQLDPNISTQYDLRELLINRNGPLPNDRPHNVKLTGAYNIPLTPSQALTLGLNFNATSGRPIEVLGTHATYGTNETFILPRGSGGRTPTITSFDLHVSYGKTLRRGLRFDATWDIFNLFDQQGVTNVDDQYALSVVNPILNGKVSDLKYLTTTSGTQPALNPNYGHATEYQAPLSMRFGLRVSF